MRVSERDLEPAPEPLSPSCAPTTKPFPWFWAAFLAALPLVAIGVPIALGKVIFSRDPAHWNMPARWIVSDALRHAQSPWWNPRQWLGLPVSSNPLYGLGYPPNWVAFFAPPASLPWVLTLLSWLHLVAGACGLGLLARRLGASPVGAAVGALAWSLSGYTVTLWTAGLLLPASAFLPWIGLALVALCDAIEAPSRAAVVAGRVAGAALAVGLSLLQGEAFVTAMAVGFGVLTALVHRPSAWRRTLPLMIAAVLLGASIGGVTLLTARAGIQGTSRVHGLSRVVSEAYSFHPWRLSELAIPHALGIPGGPYPAGAVVGEPSTDGAPLAHHAYLGVVVVALIMVALSRRDRASQAFAILGLLTLFVAFGRYTPAHALLRTLVPPTRWMRYPEKYLIMALGWSSLLAALGATKVSFKRRNILRLALLAVVLLTVWAAAAWAPGGLTLTLRSGASSALLRLTLLALLLGLRDRRERAGDAMLVLLVGADLMVEALPHLRFVSSSMPAATPPVVAMIERDRAARRVGALTLTRVYRSGNVGRAVDRLQHASDDDAERARLDSLIPNNAATFGVAILPGYDAIIAPSLEALWQNNLGRGVSLLRLLGVEYALLPTPPGGPDRSGYTAIAAPMQGVTLYRVDRPLPRVYVAERALRALDPSRVDGLFDPAVLEGREVRVGGDTPLPPGPARGRCAMVSFENAAVSARCSLDAAGAVVFVEQNDPGWSATIDGRPAELREANAVMRAVLTPAGDHLITLRFVPRGRAAGEVVTALGLAVTIGLLGWWLRERRAK